MGVGNLGRGLCLLWVLGAGGCRQEVLKYPRQQVEVAVQSFADAFNRDERGQIELMVHPERRAVFEAHRLDLETQLAHYQIERWSLGEPVVVQEKLEGRAIRVVFTDGAVRRENESIFVLQDGQWWLWKY